MIIEEGNGLHVNENVYGTLLLVAFKCVWTCKLVRFAAEFLVATCTTMQITQRTGKVSRQRRKQSINVPKTSAERWLTACMTDQEKVET